MGYYKDATSVYYSKELYKKGHFHREPEIYKNGYYIWDHLPHYSKGMEYLKSEHSLGHGLTIVRQHGEYCDFFAFSSKATNEEVNSFYLSEKELFLDFTDNFYRHLSGVVNDLEPYALRLDSPKTGASGRRDLSKRQRECATLVARGHSYKEIAKILEISPRTVEEYVHIIIDKYNVRSRLDLIGTLNKGLFD